MNYLEISWFASVDVGIRARRRFIFTFRAIFISVAFPRRRYATPGTTAEMVVGASTLSTIGWFVRPNNLARFILMCHK